MTGILFLCLGLKVGAGQHLLIAIFSTLPKLFLRNVSSLFLYHPGSIGLICKRLDRDRLGPSLAAVGFAPNRLQCMLACFLIIAGFCL